MTSTQETEQTYTTDASQRHNYVTMTTDLVSEMWEMYGVGNHGNDDDNERVGVVYSSHNTTTSDD